MPSRSRRLSIGPAARSLLALAAFPLILSGCGMADSALKPWRWLQGSGSARAPETLEPAAGYQRQDARLPVNQILSARWEPLTEGRLLVVTALPATTGWWNVALVPETPQPAGRLRADDDGVLRLRLLASPPPADQPQRVAQPGGDTITTALAISTTALTGIRQVVILGAANAISLQR
ncbi:hypothetical protein [uncultured Paracoccus sp.]|uniref:hypothetical protein n=1 Tax=uncultured Paracoccus sp. TaxID=189685 RepID=UPI00260CD802|nr:hypothetical protein [uncultured Paracoccus sp.]